MIFVYREMLDDCISKCFPPLSLMATGLMSPNGQGSIEQQYPLMGPVGQISAGWIWFMNIGFQFFKNIF